MKAFLITLGVIIFLVVSLIVGSLVYIGVVGPETYVVSGRQMRIHHTKAIKELGLLEEGEKIQYFYSDAFTDIRKGMYFLTPKHVVLYCEDWEDPQLIAPYDAILTADLDRNESWLEDSYISLVLKNEDDWTFPVSSERGKDKAFFEYLSERIPQGAEE